jgi:hypothetical protein
VDSQRVRRLMLAATIPETRATLERLDLENGG